MEDCFQQGWLPHIAQRWLTFQHVYIPKIWEHNIFRRGRDSAPQSSTICNWVCYFSLPLTIYLLHFSHLSIPNFTNFKIFYLISRLFVLVTWVPQSVLAGDPFYQSNFGNSVFCFSLPCTSISVKNFTNFNWVFSFLFFLVCAYGIMLRDFNFLSRNFGKRENREWASEPCKCDYV